MSFYNYIIDNTIQIGSAKQCFFGIEQSERMSNMSKKFRVRFFSPWEQNLIAERLKDYWSNVGKSGDQIIKSKLFPTSYFCLVRSANEVLMS